MSIVSDGGRDAAFAAMFVILSQGVSVEAFAGQPAAPARPAPTAPSPQAQGQQQTPAWTVSCSNHGNGLECKAAQTVVTAKTHQLLLSVSVSKKSTEPTAAMLLQLPHGLFNPAGLAIAIDEAKVEDLQIQTCDAKGCYAGATLTPDKIAAMSGGTKLNVVFQNLKKQSITVPVPLKGFADAFKKIAAP